MAGLAGNLLTQARVAFLLACIYHERGRERLASRVYQSFKLRTMREFESALPSDAARNMFRNVFANLPPLD